MDHCNKQYEINNIYYRSRQRWRKGKGVSFASIYYILKMSSILNRELAFSVVSEERLWINSGKHRCSVCVPRALIGMLQWDVTFGTVSAWWSAESLAHWCVQQRSVKTSRTWQYCMYLSNTTSLDLPAGIAAWVHSLNAEIKASFSVSERGKRTSCQLHYSLVLLT